MQISFDSLPNFYILRSNAGLSMGYIFNNYNKIMAGLSRGSLVIKSVIK